MRVGVYAPQFRERTAPALDVARRAESLGLDGVFLFDHLWPPGRPDGPALSQMPLLGALATVTSHITIGTLVARPDLLSPQQLRNAFVAVRELAGEDRVIAGLGTGDRVTRQEDDAYGVTPRSFEARLELLEEACVLLLAEDVQVWLAGSSKQVQAIADRHGVAINLWQPEEDKLQGIRQPFAWGGIVDGDVEHLALQLEAPRRAGATWAVCGPKGGADRPGALERLQQARDLD